MWWRKFGIRFLLLPSLTMDFVPCVPVILLFLFECKRFGSCFRCRTAPKGLDFRSVLVNLAGMRKRTGLGGAWEHEAWRGPACSNSPIVHGCHQLLLCWFAWSLGRGLACSNSLIVHGCHQLLLCWFDAMPSLNLGRALGKALQRGGSISCKVSSWLFRVIFHPCKLNLLGIYEDFRVNYRVFEAWNLRSRAAALKLSLQENLCKALRSVLGKPLRPIDHYEHKRSALIVSVDPSISLLMVVWSLDRVPASVRRRAPCHFRVQSALLCGGQALEGKDMRRCGLNTVFESCD